jgi:PAS domain S-box-containing protein
MTRDSESGEDPNHLREKIIGLGDQSIRKSYYPHLQAQVQELEQSKKELEDRSAALLNILEDLEESRRIAEENLEMFHTMADFTYDWEYWQGPGGNLIYVSPSCERITGYSPEEFLQNPGLIRDIVHQDDLSVFDSPLHRIATESGVHSLDFRIVRRDRGLRWIAQICQPVASKEGRPRGMRVSNRDITDRKAAEEAMIESEKKYRTLFENTGTAIILVEEDTVITLANGEFERLSGFTKEEIEGKKSWTEFVDKEDLDQMLARHLSRREKSDAAPGQYEFRFVMRSGDIRTISLTVDIISGTRRSVMSLMDITDRKQAEESLLDTGRRLRALLDQTYQFIGLLTPDGIVIDANRTSLEFGGMQESDVIGRFFWETPWWTHSLELQERLRDAVRRVAGGEFERFEATHPAADGSLHYIDFSLKPVKDEAGRVIYLIPEGRDITERKYTEEQVKLSKQRFNDIISHLPDATFAIDREGTIIAWNQAMEAMSGIPAAEILGRGDYAYSMPIYGEKRHLLLDLVLEDNEEIRRKYPDIRKEGDRFITDLYIPTLYGGKGAYVWCIASPLYDTNGSIIGAIESVRDVTERKRAEDAVRKSGQEWQATFDAIVDGVFLLDNQHRIIRHNRAFESFLAKPAGEIDGRYCYEVMHGISCPPVHCPLMKARESRQRENVEVKLCDRWFIAAVDPVFSDDGTLTGAVHLLTDITEHKKAEDALNQARKKLNMLNAITFSDIQNSIFALSGYLQLQKTLTADDQLQQYTDTEIGLVQTVSDCLKYAEMYQSLGLKSPVWQNVGQSFLMGISHLDISSLSRKLEVGDVVIYAEPMLENVFFALAENIVQHAPSATQYSLSYTETSEGLILAFEDNGPGITQDLKEKIFGREYSRRKGIGLYLSREILSITGIIIRETGEPGKGALFEMVVPKGMYQFADPKKSE